MTWGNLTCCQTPNFELQILTLVDDFVWNHSLLWKILVCPCDDKWSSRGGLEWLVIVREEQPTRTRHPRRNKIKEKTRTWSNDHTNSYWMCLRLKNVRKTYASDGRLPWATLEHLLFTPIFAYLSLWPFHSNAKSMKSMSIFIFSSAMYWSKNWLALYTVVAARRQTIPARAVSLVIFRA